MNYVSCWKFWNLLFKLHLTKLPKMIKELCFISLFLFLHTKHSGELSRSLSWNYHVFRLAYFQSNKKISRGVIGLLEKYWMLLTTVSLQYERWQGSKAKCGGTLLDSQEGMEWSRIIQFSDQHSDSLPCTFQWTC